MKKQLNEPVNVILGTGLLASAALFAIVTITNVSAEAEEEFIAMMTEHRITSAAAGGMRAEELEELREMEEIGEVEEEHDVEGEE